MKNFEYVVKMYFRKVSSYNILHENLNYKNFPKEDFDALSLQELKHFSETESDEMYHYLRNCKERFGQEDGLNVFRALKKFVRNLLVMRENQPLCDYDRLLEWRDLTRAVGEDFAICAFLADWTENFGKKWNDFEWPTVIGHDNVQLNCIMQKGLSDNHFHLFGSAPIFNLIWIRLMNQIDNPKYIKGLRNIDKNRRQTRNQYSVSYREDTLEKMYFQAALIRVVLFCYLNVARQGKKNEENEVLKKCSKVQNLLIEEKEYLYYREKIQCEIDSLRMINVLLQNDKTGDYANMGYCAKSINHDFEGERALLYQMMLGRVGDIVIPDFLMNWFYAYMVIQIKFREELIQVNGNIGFENFSRYSKRKSSFLFTTQDNKKMIQHAIKGSFENGNIRTLEVRIKPCRMARENAVWIRKCDKYIEEYTGKECLEHIYYVFHFAKKKDKEVKQKIGILEDCRHGKYRRALEKNAEELIKFREEYPEQAKRVLGIDACAMEIGCRPEVFASVFRQLTEPVPYNPLCSNVKQWKRTYHVGEDWLEAVDGLRAVEEAILFLEMKKGDRLGHATILGIDIGIWYKKKNYSIRLPLQDYLDNIVWLYHKLIDFNILSCDTLKGYLMREYDRCFKKLYASYDMTKLESCSIDVYYEAWKLRGDNPELFRNKAYNTGYQYLCPHWVNKTVPNGEEIRKINIIVNLLYDYHYSAEIRCLGNIREEVNIPNFYVDGVIKVQRKMQNMVAQKNIFLETNPSSNLLISTMDTYEDHPIIHLFNMGLVWEHSRLSECPQLHVSINTDDKGVFHTSIENEYALMGCALEQVVDENGVNKYQKQMVYQWLEHIRENGNQQSFLQLEEKKNGAFRENYII